jgi:hypothetical protein
VGIPDIFNRESILFFPTQDKKGCEEEHASSVEPTVMFKRLLVLLGFGPPAELLHIAS